MNIFQFLRIFWARRLMIAIATGSCVIGAVIVMMVFPPRWTGTSRAILNTLQPDPVTGLVLGKSAQTYILSQTALVTDYSVEGRVVDQLGFASDPSRLKAYRERDAGDTRDFRHWMAYNLVQGTTAGVVQGTNILQINYTAPTPDAARAVSEALRQAYMDVNLQLRRDAALHNADWYERQALKAKADLDAAQVAVASYGRANGIAMADDKSDVDTARLRALAGQGALPPVAPPPPESSQTDVQLAQIDGELVQAARTLGPNHPDVQTLKAKQAALSALAVSEHAKRAAAVAKIRVDTANAVQQALQAQKTKVVAERDKINELTRLQAVVTLDQTQFDKTQGKAMELRQQAAVTDSDIAPLGGATVPPTPSFPNVPLIIAGSIILGLGTGVLVALLSELFARRVRGVEDLRNAISAPMLGVISGPAKVRSAARTFSFPRQIGAPAGRKVARG